MLSGSSKSHLGCVSMSAASLSAVVAVAVFTEFERSGREAVPSNVGMRTCAGSV